MPVQLAPWEYGARPLGGRSYGVQSAPSMLTMSQWWDVARALKAVAGQIKLADDGAGLADYKTAGDVGLFWPAPADIVQAFYRTAYWLAVAARLSTTRRAELLAKAKGLYRMAWVDAHLPGVGYLYSRATSTFPGSFPDPASFSQTAGRYVAARADGNRNILAIAANLSGQTAQMVATAEQARYEQSVSGRAVEPLVLTVRDVAALTHDPWSVLRRLPWWSWAILGGVVLMLAAPAVYAAVKARNVARRVAPLVDRAAGAATGLRTNPRRRRRLARPRRRK